MKNIICPEHTGSSEDYWIQSQSRDLDPLELLLIEEAEELENSTPDKARVNTKESKYHE